MTKNPFGSFPKLDTVGLARVPKKLVHGWSLTNGDPEATHWLFVPLEGGKVEVTTYEPDRQAVTVQLPLLHARDMARKLLATLNSPDWTRTRIPR